MLHFIIEIGSVIALAVLVIGLFVWLSKRMAHLEGLLERAGEAN